MTHDRLPPTPPPRPKTREAALDQELRDFLRDQREADIKGTLQRLTDMVMQNRADDLAWRQEIKGDLRGHSLRIGALERRAERHEDRLDSSASWIIEDVSQKRRGAEEKLQWLRRNAVTIVLGVIAAVSSLWHLLH